MDISLSILLLSVEVLPNPVNSIIVRKGKKLFEMISKVWITYIMALACLFGVEYLIRINSPLEPIHENESGPVFGIASNGRKPEIFGIGIFCIFLAFALILQRNLSLQGIIGRKKSLISIVNVVISIVVYLVVAFVYVLETQVDSL